MSTRSKRPAQSLQSAFETPKCWYEWNGTSWIFMSAVNCNSCPADPGLPPGSSPGEMQFIFCPDLQGSAARASYAGRGSGRILRILKKTTDECMFIFSEEEGWIRAVPKNPKHCPKSASARGLFDGFVVIRQCKHPGKVSAIGYVEVT